MKSGQGCAEEMWGQRKKTMFVQLLNHGIYAAQRRNEYREKTFGLEENEEHNRMKPEDQETERGR